MSAGGEKEPVTGVLRRDVEFISSGGVPMLFDPQADAYYRVSEDMLAMAKYLTASMPVSEFIRRLALDPGEASTRRVLGLLAFLRQNNLLEPAYGETGAKRENARQMKKKTAFLRFTAAYLFFKLPPIRPERLYRRIAPWVSWLCSRTVVTALLIPALVGYAMLCREATLVRDTFLDSLSWAGLVRYFGAIAVLKVVHEAAHSLAAMHFGCRVRGVGLGFMVFYPRFFTDTTDAWRLPRRKRLLIDGAGIIAELLVGGIAALVWLYAPPGAWKSTCFYCFAVSTISTLFVNGNPCIRYDGYYMLSDAVRIPNLMQRSGEYVKRWWRYHILRLGERPQGEKGVFLLVFGACSFVYRIFLYTGIILIIYHKFVKWLAVIMMVLELHSTVIYPFWKEVRTVRALSRKSSSKAGLILALTAAAVIAAVLFVPLPWNTVMPGETVPERRVQVTVAEGGYLVDGVGHLPRVVKTGETLFALSAPTLVNAERKLAATLAKDRLTLAYLKTDMARFAEAGVAAEKVKGDEHALVELRRRQELLKMTAEADGVFVPACPMDMDAGRMLGKGQNLGYLAIGGTEVTAYADDRDLSRVRVGDKARISVAGELGTRAAEVSQVGLVPQSPENSPVSQLFGGPVQKGAVVYPIRLRFTDGGPVAGGRVVRVEIPHVERFYDRLRAYLVSVFRREF